MGLRDLNWWKKALW